ncbi:uncharacterized protein EV420DRAFT_1644948 [Desarmillaria tabescens]|uniref:Uncharacterized protein n=1 Tax=Armillaria tabescens TaxID=1929756 RepID=A0AA39K672_ARMTA|nr:uncharacterized protein EV420DRAFT_1644948 [Desarmillaria tabescens]KAK0455309.1 hypothetical protein EV420DRAFT_1644948 [Desarmillaria tabescens]
MFSSPPGAPVSVSSPLTTPSIVQPTAPSFNPPTTSFQSISAPAQLPFPIVSSVSSPHTPLQANPAAMVAQMVASTSGMSSTQSAQHPSTDPLLTTGLHPPPSFPTYNGPSTPIVNVRGNRNGTNARRQQSIHARNSNSLLNHLGVGRNSNQPSHAELCFLIMPLHCPNSHGAHENPAYLHPDDAATANWKMDQADIQPLIQRLSNLKLHFTVNVSKDIDCFREVHQALIDHQGRLDTPKITDMNLSPDVQPNDCGWCLLQFRASQGSTSLVCAKSARQVTYWTWNNLKMHCSLAKASKVSGHDVDSRFKSYFIIAPSRGSINHNIVDCYQGDFQTPIHPTKAQMQHACFPARALYGLAFISQTVGEYGAGPDQRCLRLCRGEDPNLQPSMSTAPRYLLCPKNPCSSTTATSGFVVQASSQASASTSSAVDPTPSQPATSPHTQDAAQNTSECPPFIPTHRPRSPPPYNNPKWDFPGDHLRRLKIQRISRDSRLIIYAADLKQAAEVLWNVLLHIGRVRQILLPAETLSPHAYPLTDLPEGVSVENWWIPSAYTNPEVHVDGPAVGNSLITVTLTTLLERLLNITDENAAYGHLLGGSSLIFPRMPVYNLTNEQAAFWWAHGFSLALWCLVTCQAPLPLFAIVLHALLPPDISRCRYQLDKSSPSSINSVCPDIGRFLRAWFDLQKMQPLSTHEDRRVRILEPVPEFLVEYCDPVISPHQLGMGDSRCPELHENVDRAIRALHFLGQANFDGLPAWHQYHAGFHQKWGHGFNESSSSAAPSLPTIIASVCDLAQRSTQEFVYWFCNNKLETLDQLTSIIKYNISSVEDTPLGKKVAPGIDGNFAQLVKRRFRLALEYYLSKDPIQRGTQLLKTVTASPYLPPFSRDKIQFNFVSPPGRHPVDSRESMLYQFVHSCFMSVDIGFDVALAILLAEGVWNGIPYLKGRSIRRAGLNVASRYAM